MNITVEEFVKNTSGVGEYEIWGKTQPDGSNDYDFFFREDLIKSPPAYEKFKHRKIESFEFRGDWDGWIMCMLNLED